MNSPKIELFKTTVLGIGPWCVDFGDEIVTTHTEERARMIAAAPEILKLFKSIPEAVRVLYLTDEQRIALAKMEEL